MQKRTDYGSQKIGIGYSRAHFRHSISCFRPKSSSRNTISPAEPLYPGPGRNRSRSPSPNREGGNRSFFRSPSPSQESRSHFYHQSWHLCRGTITRQGQPMRRMYKVESGNLQHTFSLKAHAGPILDILSQQNQRKCKLNLRDQITGLNLSRRSGLLPLHDSVNDFGDFTDVPAPNSFPELVLYRSASFSHHHHDKPPPAVATNNLNLIGKEYLYAHVDAASKRCLHFRPSGLYCSPYSVSEMSELRDARFRTVQHNRQRGDSLSVPRRFMETDRHLSAPSLEKHDGFFKVEHQKPADSSKKSSRIPRYHQKHCRSYHHCMDAENTSRMGSLDGNENLCHPSGSNSVISSNLWSAEKSSAIQSSSSDAVPVQKCRSAATPASQRVTEEMTEIINSEERGGGTCTAAYSNSEFDSKTLAGILHPKEMKNGCATTLDARQQWEVAWAYHSETWPPDTWDTPSPGPNKDSHKLIQLTGNTIETTFPSQSQSGKEVQNATLDVDQMASQNQLNGCFCFPSGDHFAGSSCILRARFRQESPTPLVFCRSSLHRSIIPNQTLLPPIQEKKILRNNSDAAAAQPVLNRPHAASAKQSRWILPRNRYFGASEVSPTIQRRGLLYPTQRRTRLMFKWATRTDSDDFCPFVEGYHALWRRTQQILQNRPENGCQSIDASESVRRTVEDFRRFYGVPKEIRMLYPPLFTVPSGSRKLVVNQSRPRRLHGWARRCKPCSVDTEIPRGSCAAAVREAVCPNVANSDSQATITNFAIASSTNCTSLESHHDTQLSALPSSVSKSLHPKQWNLKGAAQATKGDTATAALGVNTISCRSLLTTSRALRMEIQVSNGIPKAPGTRINMSEPEVPADKPRQTLNDDSDSRWWPERERYMYKLEALDFTQCSKRLAVSIVEMQEEKCRVKNYGRRRPELLEATERGLDRCLSIRRKKNYAIESMWLYRRLGHWFDSMPWLDKDRPIVDSEWDYGYCSHHDETSAKRGTDYYLLFVPENDTRFQGASMAVKAKYCFETDGNYGSGHYFARQLRGKCDAPEEDASRLLDKNLNAVAPDIMIPKKRGRGRPKGRRTR